MIHTVGAAHVLRQILVDLRVVQIAGAGRQINQAAGDVTLDDVLDLGVGHRRHYAIGLQRGVIRQPCAVDPRRRFRAHGIAQRPEHVAPRHHAKVGLHAAEFEGAGTFQRTLQQGSDKVQFDRQTHAGLQGVHAGKTAFHGPATAAVKVAIN